MRIIESLLLSPAFVDVSLVGLPATAALAAVALIGYIFGQRTRKSLEVQLDGCRQSELNRAAGVARKLEAIADSLRQDLAAHHARIDAFKKRLCQAQGKCHEQTWQLLCAEAEAMIAPTLEFAHQLSRAYDQIRQQSGALETFAPGRTDPLTGVGTGRALDQQLQVLLGARSKGDAEFVVALISLDRASLTTPSEVRTSMLPLLPRLAGVIQSCMRDSDFVARLGEEEFAVVMPQTSLAGAGVFADRLRKRVGQDLAATVSCGLAEAREQDDAKSLLARADSALYSAKAAGCNRMFVHTGTLIREQHGPATTMTEGAQSAGAAECDTMPTASQQGNSLADDDASQPAGMRQAEFVDASGE